jgi:hypothetical protein
MVFSNALAADDPVKNEILWTRAANAAYRPSIMLRTLDLTIPEVEVFSHVYLDYWKEMNFINDKLAYLIQDYSDTFENLAIVPYLLMQGPINRLRRNFGRGK